MSFRLGQAERRIRALSGAIVGIFVVAHLVNHMVAIYSLELAEAVRRVLMPIWHSLPGTVALYGAFLAHFVTALVALFRRSTLRMPIWEASQLLLGLMVIPLVVTHAAAMRGIHEVFGVTHHYARVSLSMWGDVATPTQQAVLTIVVWIHFALGIHFWLRVKRWYPRVQMMLQAFALLIPILALIGFTRAGQQVAVLRNDEVWRTTMLAGWGDSPRELFAFVNNVTESTLIGYFGLLVLILVMRQLRNVVGRRRGAFQLRLPDGRLVSGAKGRTILEALRAARVPHASVCGGRGRCTTCRVRVGTGIDELPLPSGLEAAALSRIGAPGNVRLACQTRPLEMASITPVLSSDASPASARQTGGVSGREQVVTTMFLDLRGSTALGEKKLPYDVLFILNQFFAEMSSGLKESHGHYAQFAGDGLMALYGLERGEQQGARDALGGATRMLARLAELNERLSDELDAPLRIGIGMHTGEAIVGTMGPPTSPNYSAIGDNINIAARLEAKTKDLKCTVVVSASTLTSAGAAATDYPHEKVDVRGREGDILVAKFQTAAELPSFATAPA
jgi:adenylate cyclase